MLIFPLSLIFSGIFSFNHALSNGKPAKSFVSEFRLDLPEALAVFDTCTVNLIMARLTTYKQEDEGSHFLVPLSKPLV